MRFSIILLFTLVFLSACGPEPTSYKVQDIEQIYVDGVYVQLPDDVVPSMVSGISCLSDFCPDAPYWVLRRSGLVVAAEIRSGSLWLFGEGDLDAAHQAFKFLEDATGREIKEPLRLSKSVFLPLLKWETDGVTMMQTVYGQPAPKQVGPIYASEDGGFVFELAPRFPVNFVPAKWYKNALQGDRSLSWSLTATDPDILPAMKAATKAWNELAGMPDWARFEEEPIAGNADITVREGYCPDAEPTEVVPGCTGPLTYEPIPGQEVLTYGSHQLWLQFEQYPITFTLAAKTYFATHELGHMLLEDQYPQGGGCDESIETIMESGTVDSTITFVPCHEFLTAEDSLNMRNFFTSADNTYVPDGIEVVSGTPLTRIRSKWRDRSWSEYAMGIRHEVKQGEDFTLFHAVTNTTSVGYHEDMSGLFFEDSLPVSVAPSQFVENPVGKEYRTCVRPIHGRTDSNIVIAGAWVCQGPIRLE